MSDFSRRVSAPTAHDIAWFIDLNERKKLDFDPPYQRRSVWTPDYQSHFIDTILLGYPAPPIFLFKRLTDTGQATYEIVDGKQRLTTILQFVADKFPVSNKSPRANLRGRKFSELESPTRIAFFDYDLLVDFLPTNDEAIINDIFDRLNRNVARLQPQELRHARFSGVFITRAEELALWTWGGDPPEAGEEDDDAGEEIVGQLPNKFPRISNQARKTMKDVEVVASLLLYLEEGVKSYSTVGVDAAFASRDQAWPAGVRVEDEYRRTIVKLREILNMCNNGWPLIGTRLANQADFYSLFGAVASLNREGMLPTPADMVARLGAFVAELVKLNLESLEESDHRIAAYSKAARSNSNDATQRSTRINILREVLTGVITFR